jgi:hypothetical protein
MSAQNIHFCRIFNLYDISDLIEATANEGHARFLIKGESTTGDIVCSVFTMKAVETSYPNAWLQVLVPHSWLHTGKKN